MGGKVINHVEDKTSIELKKKTKRWQEERQDFSEVMEMFYSSVVVMVTGGYKFVRLHPNVFKGTLHKVN